MFQRTTNLTTILAILGVPTTLFGGSSGRGTRQRAPEGRLGGCQVWRDLYDLCKIQKIYIFLVIFYKSEFHMTARIFGPQIGAPGGGQISRHHQVCEQSKENDIF